MIYGEDGHIRADERREGARTRPGPELGKLGLCRCTGEELKRRTSRGRETFVAGEREEDKWKENVYLTIK